MSDFLFACIEEAKRSGLYSESPPRMNIVDMPASITILDSDICEPTAFDGMSEESHDGSFEVHVDPVVTPIPHELVPKSSTSDSSTFEGIAPTEGLYSKEQLILMDEIRSLGKQLDLCKQTVSKQAADLSRLRRNHGFDMRLLQKTINNLQHNISKDSKTQAELAERVIKLSTERDILKLQESSTEEQLLTLKQSLISVMNERNQLIRELRLGSNPSHLSDVLVLGPSRIVRLSLSRSEPFQVEPNIEYIDLREHS